MRSLGVKTALGVSNVSFGLPNRGLLNRTFLTMAMTCGLNMPIMNPLDGEMTGAVKAFGVLSGEDENSENYIEIYKDFSGTVTALNTPKTEHITGSNLYDCIKKGLKNEAAALCAKELENTGPMTVVNDILIKALEEVGALYDSGKLYLPQLVSSAEAAKKAFEAVGKAMPKGTAKKAKIILATVNGDVHDIGKNIVKVVLESYGYEVIDLGKDVPPEAVVEAYFKHMAGAIGAFGAYDDDRKEYGRNDCRFEMCGVQVPRVRGRSRSQCGNRKKNRRGLLHARRVGVRQSSG